MIDCRDAPSFNGSRSDSRAVVCARATIDLGFRDVEDVPFGNLEELGAAEIGTPVRPGDESDIVPTLKGG